MLPHQNIDRNLSNRPFIAKKGNIRPQFADDLGRRATIGTVILLPKWSAKAATATRETPCKLNKR